MNAAVDDEFVKMLCTQRVIDDDDGDGGDDNYHNNTNTTTNNNNNYPYPPQSSPQRQQLKYGQIEILNLRSTAIGMGWVMVMGRNDDERGNVVVVAVVMTIKLCP